MWPTPRRKPCPDCPDPEKPRAGARPSAAGWLSYDEGFAAASDVWDKPTGGRLCPERGHHAPLLHLRHHRHAQDGRPITTTTPWGISSRRYTGIQVRGRRAAPDRVGNRLGQVRVGQALWPVAGRQLPCSSMTLTSSTPAEHAGHDREIPQVDHLSALRQPCTATCSRRTSPSMT